MKKGQKVHDITWEQTVFLYLHQTLLACMILHRLFWNEYLAAPLLSSKLPPGNAPGVGARISPLIN